MRVLARLITFPTRCDGVGARTHAGAARLSHTASMCAKAWNLGWQPVAPAVGRRDCHVGAENLFWLVYSFDFKMTQAM